MTIAFCILIAVSLILVGWFAGRYWELTVWITRCRTTLSALKAVEQRGKMSNIDNIDNWDCWNPSHPVGSVVLYHNWPHLVIETEDQGLRLAAFQPPYSQR